MTGVNFGDERLPARFWDKVQPCPMSGCWLWTGGANFYTKESKNWRRGKRPRRVPFDVAYPRAANTPLLNKCGVDTCCNPEHMRKPVGRLKPQEALARDKATRIRTIYGISIDRYNEMLAGQRGRCAICSRKFTTKHYGMPCIDHCHRTGKVRGLLCRKCNAGIGALGECLFTLANASTYLFKHNGMPRSGVELEEGDPGYGDHTHE